MSNIEGTLSALVDALSEENYDETFAWFRFWLNFGSEHATHINVQARVDDTILRLVQPEYVRQRLIHPTAHLLIRFIGDLEADHTISRHAQGLHMRLCKSTLCSFFSENFDLIGPWGPDDPTDSFLINVNLIARWANLGYVEEETIRDHILQSLIPRPILYDHQADALIIIFKLAGATFGAYTDPSVIDRCFDLLKGCYGRDRVKAKLLQVFPPRIVKGTHRAEMDFQEVVELRESGWEGLPPPPVFMTGKAKMAGANEKDPAATPVMKSSGIPTRHLEPQLFQPPPEPIVLSETDTIAGSPVPQSPSISITTSALSDLTVADTSDDEPPLDSATITPHDAFYLEDGNAEVLCGNTLFRIHAGVMSFHSPVLGQMFAKANLADAESPNGCPRIPSSDTVTDFTTLLKVIYLPAYAALPLWR
jgi:hypothetical protein